MLFIARGIKKPKGNGIRPEGCKKIDANLAVIRTFSPPLASAFEVPIYQGSFYIV